MGQFNYVLNTLFLLTNLNKKNNKNKSLNLLKILLYECKEIIIIEIIYKRIR